MNTEKFSGKAGFYAIARPGYPDSAVEYIKTLVKNDTVFADIGAGTGKFTVSLAECGYKIFAVEPNADMRGQLISVMKSYPNVEIVDGTAENTKIPSGSVGAVTCAQALHWFCYDDFRAECRRIGGDGVMVIAIYNLTPGGSSIDLCEESTGAFFKNPKVREFPNPIFYTRESWVQYMSSHSINPLPSDPEYAAHIDEVNAIFDEKSVDGILRVNVVTKIFSEIIE